MEEYLYGRLMQGLETARQKLGDVVDFLSAKVQGRHDGTYLLRLYFSCEIQQMVDEVLIEGTYCDVVPEIGCRMAVALVQSIRKVVLAAGTGMTGPDIFPDVETRLDASVPEGVVLMHPKTLRNLLTRRDDR